MDGIVLVLRWIRPVVCPRELPYPDPISAWRNRCIWLLLTRLCHRTHHLLPMRCWTGYAQCHNGRKRQEVGIVAVVNTLKEVSALTQADVGIAISSRCPKDLKVQLRCPREPYIFLAIFRIEVHYVIKFVAF